MKNLAAIVAAVSVTASVPALAAIAPATPISSPAESRIVRYSYSPNVIYRIYAAPGHHTHIALSPDEGLSETPVAGDTLQWRVSGGPTNLYVKPVTDGIQTSMTVVTNRRVYEFELIASGKKRYQKVSFDYPEASVATNLVPEKAGPKQPKAGAGTMKASSPEALDFDFEIRGDAPFTPKAAFTDGVFTYLKLGVTQDVPAVFMVEDDGSLSLVNYRITQGMVVVERLGKKLLLKLGRDEAHVTYRGTR